MPRITESRLEEYIDRLVANLELDADMEVLLDKHPTRKSIYIDYHDIVVASPEGFDHHHLLEYPDHTLEKFEEVLVDRSSKSSNDLDIHVRIRNIPRQRKRKVKNLRVKSLYEMIHIEGLVTRITKVVPNMKTSVFRCNRCEATIERKVEGDKVEEPPQCPRCDKSANKTDFDLLEDRCEYVDYQMIEIQDPPESLKGHEQPERLECIISDDICGKLLLSDYVGLTGTLLNKRRGKKKRTGDWMLEVNSIEVKNTEFEEMSLTDEDVEEIEELADEGNIFPRIVRSIAPSIKGYRMVKKGLALMLFSGVRKTMMDGQKIRGNLHVLMVGDPGTAKSQLISRMADIAPRGMQGSGKGTTSAGLTAAAVQVEVLGENKWVAQAGTLVLADKGLAAIDELDKMSENDRGALHEAMEQQTVTIDKADIHTTFNARTSVLSACNPVEGRFEEHMNISEQIGLPAPLISRFDLIYPIRDVVDEERDKRISKHILNLHKEGQKLLTDEDYEPDDDFKAPISNEMFRRYISYAKTIVPVLTDEAFEHIDDFYLELREKGDEADNPIPITARQEESVIRMAEASARMHLREEVTLKDAEIATSIMRYYIHEVIGGDIDLIMSDTSFDQRTTLRKMQDILTELGEEYGEEGVPMGELRETIIERGIDIEQALKTLDRMKDEGMVYRPSTDRYRLV